MAPRVPIHRVPNFSHEARTFGGLSGKAVYRGGYSQAMHIRPYKCEVDRVSVLAVFDRTFPDSHSFLERYEQTMGRQHLELLLGCSETLIAEIYGSVIGFITLDGNGYISALYVHRPKFGRGVGSTLLHTAQNRHKRLRLHVFAENDAAVQFYRAQDFAVIDEDQQIDSLGYRHRRFEMFR